MRGAILTNVGSLTHVSVSISDQIGTESLETASLDRVAPYERSKLKAVNVCMQFELQHGAHDMHGPHEMHGLLDPWPFQPLPSQPLGRSFIVCSMHISYILIVHVRGCHV